MNTKIEETQPKLDGLKWLVVLVLVAAAVVGNSHYGAEPLLYRVLAIIAAALLALWVGSLTAKGQAFVDLVKEARVETRKVVWPTRQETTQTTMVVVVVVLIASLILWLLDTFLGWIVSSLIG
ncbi:MAG: preprotein translocase subunit SecE [Pseudomonadales bacterium]|nr:preprotein translocase subunit SecE [Pseudomonadales bacterium]